MVVLKTKEAYWTKHSLPRPERAMAAFVPCFPVCQPKGTASGTQNVVPQTVDDGMYLYSIAHGRPNVKPVMPAKALDGTSWPLETFGSMYANFGVFGVFIGMLLIGMIIGWSYRKMVLEKFSFLWLLMYIHILFSFEISTLRIFQTFIFFISIFVISFIVKKIH